MPVVLYHRKKHLSRVRWYKTTGIRLRHASYRTRYQTRNAGYPLPTPNSKRGEEHVFAPSIPFLIHFSGCANSRLI